MSDRRGGKRDRGGGHGGAQKKHKGWAASHAKDPSAKAIPNDSWGMLLTCQGGRDRRAVDEARVLFEEAYARMGKSDLLHSSQTTKGDDGGGGGGEEAGAAAAKPSVDALLAAEVAEIKDVKKALFRWHDTGVPNTIYVNFPAGDGLPSPSEVAANVVDHVRSTKQLPARFLVKMLPIEATCFVGIDEIKKLAGKFLPQHFAADAAEGSSFAVEMERRACSNLDHMEIVDAFAKAVPCPPFKVNLREPDRTILVQLVRNVCAVAVAPRYKELFRYNLRVAAEPEDKEDKDKEGKDKEKKDEEGKDKDGKDKDDEQQEGGEGGGKAEADAEADAGEKAEAGAAPEGEGGKEKENGE